MRPHRYADAEHSFRRALATTAPLPPHDARIRASLGNLVRVAAAYHSAGRTVEAESLMALVREHVNQQRTASRTAVRYDDLDRSFLELTRVRPSIVRRPGRGRSSESPVHHGFDPLINENARRFGLDPALVKAVVAAESNFQVAAVSLSGAQGLMQLMPGTARQMGVKAPFDPRENLMGGSRYLRDMLDRYDDVKLALAAYNAGPEAVDRYDGIPPYPETTAYVKRVLRYFEDYRQQATR
jgi:soluble lytic murein transglycosylase-like protein